MYEPFRLLLLNRKIVHYRKLDFMNKLLFTLFVLLSTLSYLYAEDDVHVIEIRYEVYVENTDSLSSFQYNLPYEAYHVVSPDHILTLKKYAADVDEVHVYDLEHKIDYQCFLKLEEQSIAVKNPLFQIPTLVSNDNDGRIYQIGGMRCKKYEILHKGEPIEIYTTDVFGVDFTPFSQVQGYAMQYTFIDDVYGKVTYVAKSILPGVISKSTFSLDGFKITDKIYPEDLRNPIEKTLIAKESKSLFKLNKKKIGYQFRLANKSKVTNESNPDNLVVIAVCGFHKLSSMDNELMKGMINSLENKNVDFYYFATKHAYSKAEISALEATGFEVAFLKDLFLSKFKVDYFPTYILLDKNRKVVKYKIGTDSNMLSSFGEKIIELSED